MGTLRLSDSKYMQAAVAARTVEPVRPQKGLPRVAVTEGGYTQYGWLRADDGENATVFLDDLTRLVVPSFAVRRLGREEGISQVKAAREAIAATLSRRADLVVASIDPESDDAAEPRRVVLSYNQAYGDPSEDSVVALIAERLGDCTVLDAVVPVPGKIIAMVRTGAAGYVSAREAAEAITLGDPCRYGDWIEMPVKYDAKVFAQPGAPSIMVAIKQRILQHVGINGGAMFGMIGPVHVELADADGQATARFQCSAPGPFPQRVET